MTRALMLTLPLFLFACDEALDTAASPSLTDEPADVDGKTKDDGGDNGDYDYCDGDTPCLAGEGDCDTNFQCAWPLVCGVNVGADWDMPYTWDVCVGRHCDNGVQDGDESGVDVGGSCSLVTCSGVNGDEDGYCTEDCTCSWGEGDCDRDSQCGPGLVCGENNGARYGMPSNYDVCEPARPDVDVDVDVEIDLGLGG